MKKIGGIFAFKVKGGPGGAEAVWVVDVKNGSGSVTNDAGQQTVDNKVTSCAEPNLPQTLALPDSHFDGLEKKKKKRYKKRVWRGWM